ncbi:MAG: DUF1361 domain-containing protein [Candidatus Pacebacteria bacterium]|nr:DUF1361 domain-containing protein [Candidatus Paceibacterota bacterium]MCD8507924.1 DUF1361 domain-containing protein [Candidatus Paceibacterota bacterium]MCD8528276.1 DUF1361 domain-containing protein [Candidatus Paceibacterota bacterium]MCD8563965.1 DUF1361 domain-containing protein [Candidatus Paceibacterota bacterium]
MKFFSARHAHPFVFLWICYAFVFTVLALLPREQSGFWIAMLWNLFLVAVPLALALGMLAVHILSIRVILWLLALVTLPNAWYVLTDVRHLIWLHPKPDGAVTIVRYEWDMLAGGNVWMSELLLFLLAALGIAAGAYAGYILARELASHMKRLTYHWNFLISVVTIAYMSGFAIYIGRYIRLNSWDVITRPHIVAAEIFHAHTDPYMLFVTLLYGSIALVSIYTVQYIAQSVGSR